MKIGIFTDSHYSSAALSCGVRYNSESLRKIKEAYSFFEKEGCELVVCLGDLIDTEQSVEKEKQNLAEIASVMGKSPIRTVCLMGNHDAFTLDAADFYGILGVSREREICPHGVALLFLDTCYFRSGKHYAPGDSDWTDCFLPEAEALKKRLSELSENAYIFMHQNVDSVVPSDHRLYNADEVLDIITSSGAVRKVFQGHYHKGAHSVKCGVEFITLPAMCENEGAYWVYEI